MGFKKMNNEFSFADVVLESSKKNDKIIKSAIALVFQSSPISFNGPPCLEAALIWLPFIKYTPEKCQSRWIIYDLD